jgi:MFS family permease
MLGDGLQGTLLAVRASQEAFPTTVTGLVLSSFYVGFLGGSIFAPRIVERVGHIHVFAALASLASASILIHSVVVTPLAWGILRFLSGFCFAGIYVVAESWLNDRATNQTRGQLLSLYMVITYGGVAGGQLLLNVAHPGGQNLFILASVLISFALVPLLLSAGQAPHLSTPLPVSLRKLYAISPLGVVGALGTGMATAGFFAMAPVYAATSGLDVAEISLFMTAAVVGCIALQWPIGHLSDKFDRRTVLTAVTFLAGLAALGIVAASPRSLEWLLLATAVFGGFSLPMYALCIAHANDFLEPEQMVAASGALVLASGLGAIAGPTATSAIMSLAGASGLFWMLAAVHFCVGFFALYRMAVRRSMPVEQQGSYSPASLHASQVNVEWSLADDD